MAYDTQLGQGNLRTTYYDKALKALAERMYKFKQAMTISPTTAWTNYIWRESPTPLTSLTTSGITASQMNKIPRGAAFPNATPTWERISAVITKYGLEANIPMEDIWAGDVDVEGRCLFKLAEGVAKSVDDTIWDTLTESRSVSTIQSITNAANYEWDSSSAAIIDNLLQCKQKISEYNYPTENLMCFVSPKDYRNLMTYLTSKGAQFPSISQDVTNNGTQGSLCGIKLVMSNSVTASYALVVVPQIVGAWKELVPLQTEVTDDKFKTRTIRAAELGQAVLYAPKAACLIINTQHN